MYSNWLSFDLADPERIVHASVYKDSYYKEFCAHYVLRTTNEKPQNSISFKTRLMWLSDIKPELDNATVTGLWKVFGI